VRERPPQQSCIQARRRFWSTTACARCRYSRTVHPGQRVVREHVSADNLFTEVDRTCDPDFFVRFMDEAQKPAGIARS
jgi:hypothetical protein